MELLGWLDGFFSAITAIYRGEPLHSARRRGYYRLFPIVGGIGVDLGGAVELRSKLGRFGWQDVRGSARQGREARCFLVLLMSKFQPTRRAVGRHSFVALRCPTAWLGIELLEARQLLSVSPTVTTVLNNGPAANRIDLAVVGDGFTQSQLSTYTANVQSFINGFFNEAPLSSYKSFFNVHQVNVVSDVSGVSDDPNRGVTRDTPLGMSFWTGGVERLLGVNTWSAREFSQLAPGDDQTIAIANSSKYGGAGYTSEDVLTFAGGNPSAIEIVKHEFGHAFADLADEYEYGGATQYSGPEPSEADLSTFTASEMLAKKTKWWRWIGVQGVGAYEGAAYSQTGIYRPTLNSKMRTLGLPFGAVNTEQLIEQMYLTVDPIDSHTPAGTYPANTNFFVKPLHPADHKDAVQWLIDGKTITGANSVTFNPGSIALTAGKHTLSVKVSDNTTAVRDEAFRIKYMTQTSQWTINSAPAPVYHAGTLAAGYATYKFSVTFSGDPAIKVASLDSFDVRVIGPNGFNQPATFVSVNNSTNGASRTATYQIKAPGGTWDTPDNGAYTINLQGSQVSDVAGHFAPAATLGTVQAAFPSSITLSGRAYFDHNADGIQQANDQPLSNVKIYIDSDRDGVRDASEPLKITDAAGNYSFTALTPGQYRLRTVVPTGFRLTTPTRGYFDFTLVMGQRLTGRNFGATQQSSPSAPPRPTQETADDDELNWRDCLPA